MAVVRAWVLLLLLVPAASAQWSGAHGDATNSSAVGDDFAGDGALAWTIDSVRVYGKGSAGPTMLASNGTHMVIVQPGRIAEQSADNVTEMRMVRLLDGRTEWNATLDLVAEAGPVWTQHGIAVVGERGYRRSDGGFELTTHIVLVAPDTGRVLVEQDLPRSVNWRGFVGDADGLYASLEPDWYNSRAGNKGLVKLSATDLTVQWLVDVPVGALQVHDEVVFIRGYRNITAVAPDGTVVWVARFPSHGLDLRPVAVGDGLVVATNEQEAWVWNATIGVPVWRYESQEKLVSAPVVAGNRVLLIQENRDDSSVVDVNRTLLSLDLHSLGVVLHPIQSKPCLSAGGYGLHPELVVAGGTAWMLCQHPAKGEERPQAFVAGFDVVSLAGIHELAVPTQRGDAYASGPALAAGERLVYAGSAVRPRGASGLMAYDLGAGAPGSPTVAIQLKPAPTEAGILEQMSFAGTAQTTSARPIQSVEWVVQTSTYRHTMSGESFPAAGFGEGPLRLSVTVTDEDGRVGTASMFFVVDDKTGDWELPVFVGGAALALLAVVAFVVVAARRRRRL